MATPFLERLTALATEYPYHPVVRVAGKSLTYSDWLYRSLDRANALRDQEVGPDDVVALSFSGESWDDWLTDLTAVHMCGAIATTWPPGADSLARSELQSQVGVTCEAASNAFARFTFDRSIAKSLRIEREGAADGGFALTDICFTSGTTGRWQPVFCEAGAVYPAVTAQYFATRETNPAVTPPIIRIGLYAPPGSAAAQSVVGQALWPKQYYADGLPQFNLLSRFSPAKLENVLKEDCLYGLRLTPSQFRLFARDYGACRYTDIQWIKLAGEYASPDVVAEVRSLFPNARVSNIFGATETGRAALHSVETDGTLLAPTPGTEAAVLNDEGIIASDGDIGELALKLSGPSHGHRYTDIQHDCPAWQSNPWIRTGDLARSVRGQLEIVGRTKRCLNVGGAKFPCQRIEEVCRLVQGVPDAAALPIDDPLLGETAYVFYLSDDGSSRDRELAKVCRSHLPASAVPTRFHLVSELPLSDVGKVDYGLLKERTRPIVVEPSMRTDPRRLVALELFLIRTVCTVVGADGSLSPNDSLTSVGLDSLSALEICMIIADQFDVDISPTELFTSLSDIGKISLHISNSFSGPLSETLGISQGGFLRQPVESGGDF